MAPGLLPDHANMTGAVMCFIEREPKRKEALFMWPTEELGLGCTDLTRTYSLLRWWQPHADADASHHILLILKGLRKYILLWGASVE